MLRIDLKRILANERRWLLEQRHIARQSPVIPPVEILSRDLIGPATIIHFYDEIISACVHMLRNLERKWSESPLMHTQLDSVEPHAGFVVGSSELHEKPATRAERVIEVAAI